MLKEKIIIKLDQLIGEGETILSHYMNNVNNMSYSMSSQKRSDESSYHAYRVSCLSFIELIAGAKNQFYKNYEAETNNYGEYKIKFGIKILQRIKEDIRQGWFTDLRNLISAEIFDDFIEMAAYLLSEGYKDPAAVMIGGVLEEHLRELCRNNNIETTFESRGKIKPKKANTMNTDLAKEDIYNKLVQKSVVAWLDLRNKAAHGKYTEYSDNQVKSMLENVRDFIVKTST